MEAASHKHGVRTRDDTALILFLVCATTYLGPFSQTIYTPSLVALRESFSTTNVMAGATVGVFALALAVGQLFYGLLVDRYSGRNLLIGGVVLYSIGSVLCFFAPTVELFILARAVQSIGVAAGLVIGGAIVSDRIPAERRGAAMSRLQSANGAGAATGPILGGLIAYVATWQVSFLALAVIGSVIAILLVRWMPATRDHGQPITFRSITRTLKNPATLGVIIVGFTLYYAHFTFVGLAPVLYREQFDLPEVLTGVILLGHALSLITGSTIGGAISDRFGRRSGVLLGATGTLVVTFLYSVIAQVGSGVPILLLLAVLQFGFGFSQGIGIPSHLALMVEWFPQTRGSAVGSYVSLRYLGAAVGPVIGGVLIDRLGLWSPFAGASILLLLALVVAIGVVHRPPESAEPVKPGH